MKPFIKWAGGKRWLTEHQLLDSLHHATGLAAMRARANLQVMVGLRNAKLTKEQRGHVVIVVLSGVHQLFVVMAPQHMTHGCRFDELWTCTNDRQDSGHAEGERAAKLNGLPERHARLR